MEWLLIIPILLLWLRVSTLSTENRHLNKLLQALTAQVEALRAGVLKAGRAEAEVAVEVEAQSSSAAPVSLDWDIALGDREAARPPEAARPAAPPMRYAPPPKPPAPPKPYKPQPYSPPQLALPPSPSFVERAFAVARDWLLGGNTVVRVGLVLLFFGLAFLLRFASEKYSPPVEYRYVGVALVALVLLALGWWLRLKRPAYGLTLQGAGVAVLYLTSFAAMRLHHLLPPEVVFGLLVLLTAAAAVLAILQDAMGLACAAALGGFAAPVLASTGSGDHVMLFSYFALLNTGILLIAWFKAWRALNLIGFAGTFCVGFAWGIRFYVPEFFVSTEPFLVLFFLMYVGIGLLFARRKLLAVADAPEGGGRQVMLRWSTANTDYVDGSMMFGPPLIGFGLQCALIAHIEFGMAFSALGLGLFYLALALLLRARPRVSLLMEICLALGVVFGTLAIPLAFEARWTVAAWAVEGAGIYWLGLVQRRRLARVFSLALIAAAAVFWLPDLDVGSDAGALLRHVSPLGALLLGGALLFCHRVLRRAPQEALADWDRPWLPVFAVAGLVFLYLLVPLCFGVEYNVLAWALAGGVTLFAGLRLNSGAFLACAGGVQVFAGMLFLHNLSAGAPAQAVLAWGWLGTALALVGLCSAWRLHQVVARQADRPLALDPRQLAAFSGLLLVWGVGWWVWVAADQVAGFVSTHVIALDFGYLMLLALSLSGLLWMVVARLAQWRALALACLLPLAAAAWVLVTRGASPELLIILAWCVFFDANFILLRSLARLLPAVVQSGAHVLGVWLLVGVLALLALNAAEDWLGAVAAWRWLAWALVPSLYLWLVSGERGQFWPLKTFAREYRVLAALPVMVAMLLWFGAANFSEGVPAPLPYVPLVNPLEVGLLLVLLACWRWSRVRLPEFGDSGNSDDSGWLRHRLRRGAEVVGGACLLVFLLLVVCRVVHFWGGVDFTPDALTASMVVQAGWSLVGTLYALALMVGGSRLGSRRVWVAGAVLVAVVVLKLLFVELGEHSSLARIVSFIGVGVLLLIVGYFSPLPPRAERPEGKENV
jgi:uncharacterized membrane protein